MQACGVEVKTEFLLTVVPSPPTRCRLTTSAAREAGRWGIGIEMYIDGMQPVEKNRKFVV